MSRRGDRLASEGAARYAAELKRGQDVVTSLAALTVFVPILILLALAISLESRGPAFFLQPRIGIDRRRRRVSCLASRERRHVSQPGRPSRMIRLRMMSCDAEADGPQWAVANDARIARLGSLLRRTRLDEIPQFVNVLRGEMSVVGPRPEPGSRKEKQWKWH